MDWSVNAHPCPCPGQHEITASKCNFLDMHVVIVIVIAIVTVNVREGVGFPGFSGD